MTPKRPPASAVLLAALLPLLCAVWLHPAHASCGIRECPVPEPTPPRWAFTTEVRQTAFEDEYEGVTGNYTQLDVRADVRVGRLRAAGLVPFVTLRRGAEEERTGLGNPVAMSEVRLLAAPAWRSGLGVQLEFPWGDSEQALAADHHELLPYAWVATGTERGGLSATVGLRMALGGEASEPVGGSGAAPFASGISMHQGQSHREPVYVNPHEERELGWRAGGGRQLFGSGWSGSAFVEGNYVLQGPTEGTHYVSGEIALAIPAGGHVALGTYLAVPLSSARRFEITGGLGLSFR